MIKTLSKKTVMLVSDNGRGLAALDNALWEEGYNVTCSNLVADAINFLVQQKMQIDLIIADLWTPTLTSLAGLHAIHSLFPDLPVIVLSASGTPEVKAACLRLRVAYLEKPVERWQLLSAVEGVFASQKAGSRSLRRECSGENR
jgi:DNA-binding NtrC family response regulator